MKPRAGLACLVSLALLMAACGTATTPPAQSTSDAGHSATPIGAWSSGYPAAPPSSAATTSAQTPGPNPLAAGMCTAAQLAGTVTGWYGDTGTPLAYVTITNVSSAGCDVRGTSEAQIVDGHGGIVGDAGPGAAGARLSDTVFTLAPGASVQTTVRWGNWCTALPPAQNVTVAFVLPLGLGRFVAGTSRLAPIADCAMSAESAPVVTSEPWRP